MITTPKLFEDIPKLEQYLRTKSETFWIKRGSRMVKALFKEMRTSVPAYKIFLKQHKIPAKEIKTLSDLSKITPLDKNNYLRKYKTKDLVWEGDFVNKQWTVSATSGSTGEPFYFPRQTDQNLQYAAVAELYLRANFKINKRSTLYVNAFPMGAWIGGVFTYEAVRILATRGNYRLSIISPGVHKREVIRAIRNLGGLYDQVIIGCYGPFLKDILDDGVLDGVNWKKYNLGFVFSAEGFTEGFRDYIMDIAGAKNRYTNTLNHYGTVDLGTMSYETPISILIRRLALQNQALFKDLFGDTRKVPTFTQYFPELFYFEEDNGRLFCSALSGIPLFRYDLKDKGGVKMFSEVERLFTLHNINLGKIVREAGIADTVWQLPFVYVFERDDFSVSFYAFQIYPETGRRALIHQKLKSSVSGKFMMSVEYTSKQDQKLIFYVELRPNKKPKTKLKMLIRDILKERLLDESSEYRETYKAKGSKINPVVRLKSYGDPKYFPSGAKQKWVKK